MDFVVKRVSPHLAKPGGGFWGFVTKRLLVGNRPIEEATYKNLDVKPDETVLEVGFGYGPGIDYAMKNGFRESSGTFYGVDYSNTVCEVVTKEFDADIKSGKLKILNEDVAKMSSIADSSIDKVFHTNCFYFWPDMAAAATEVFRVMKPGGKVVTGLDVNRVNNAVQKGSVTESQVQTKKYSDAMSAAGFIDVQEEGRQDEETKSQLTFVYATKPQ